MTTRLIAWLDQWAGPIALQVAVAVTLMLIVALVVSWGLRRSAASLRHRVWALAILGLLAYPAVQPFLPKVSLGLQMASPVNPSDTGPTATNPSESPSFARTVLPAQDRRLVDEIATHTNQSTVPLPVPKPQAGEEGGIRLSVAEALTRASTLHWPSILAAFWTIGTVIGLGFLVNVHLAAYRLVRTATEPSDPSWSETAGVLAAQLGVRRRVAVRISDRIAVPVTAGWLRPVILLPSDCDGWIGSRRRMVLIHELSHVARGDVLWQVAAKFACMIYWLHPLVWLAARRMRVEREAACDDAVLRDVERPSEYASLLLDVAASLAERPIGMSTAAIAMACGRSVEERIRWIVQPGRCRLPIGRRTAMLFSVGAILLVVGLGSISLFAGPPVPTSSEPATGADTWKPGQTLDFRVVNAKTKEPLDGVELRIGYWAGGSNSYDINKIQTTDAQGRSEIKLPDGQPELVQIYPSKTGFVPLLLHWRSEPAPPVIPKTLTVALEPGTIIGGVIKNEEGKPIVDVTVNVRYQHSDNPEGRPYQAVFIKAKATTDKNGRWRINAMPAQVVLDELRVYLTHPGYVSDYPQDDSWPLPITERPDYNSLRDHTAVMVMHKGATITGRVTDDSGKPIAGASICNQYDCYDPKPLKLSTITDNDGYFRLSGLTHRQNYKDYFFTVQAAGYAPLFVEVSDADSEKPVDIKLTPGRSVQGKIVDENGKPLEGVSIKLDYWMGRPRQFYLRTMTDTAGKFRIDDAPLDRTEYDIEKKGFITVRRPLPLSPTAYTVALKRPLCVTGTIVDSETNKPLARCRLSKGWDFEDGRNPEWETAIGIPAKEVTNGRYEFEFTQEHGTRIRVDAEGYMPAVSRMFKPGDTDNGHETYDFRLKKAGPMTGTVFGPNDTPLAGAEVFLATQQFNVKNRKPGPPVGEKRRMVKTDKKGRFEFPPEVEPFCLVVLDEQGFAVIDEKQFAERTEIHIKPWTEENQNFTAERRPSRGRAESPTGGAAQKSISESAKDIAAPVTSTVTTNVRPTAEETHQSQGPILRGRIVDESGNPLPGIHVVLYSGIATRWRGQEANTNANGEYQFDPLNTGAAKLREGRPSEWYTGVQFEHDEYVPADGRSWRDIQVPMVDRHEYVLDMKMVRGGKVSGIVVNADTGKPAGELGLRIHNGFVNGKDNSDFLVYATTDGSGRFTSRPLFPGQYVAEINNTKQKYPKIGKAVVRAGETTEIRMTTQERPELQDPFRITGTAVGDDGHSLVYGGVGLRITGSDNKLRTAGGGIDGRNIFNLNFGPIERITPSSKAPYGVGTYDVELFGWNTRFGYKLVKRTPSEPLRITDDPNQPELKDGIRYIRPNQSVEFQLVFKKDDAAPKSDSRPVPATSAPSSFSPTDGAAQNIGEPAGKKSARFHLVRGNTTWIGTESAPLQYDDYDKLCYWLWDSHTVVLPRPTECFFDFYKERTLRPGVSRMNVSRAEWPSGQPANITMPGTIDLPTYQLLLQPSVQRALNLSKEQRTKLQDISAKYWSERRQIAGKALDDIEAAAQKKMAVEDAKAGHKGSEGFVNSSSIEGASPFPQEVVEKLERQWSSARKQIEDVLTPEQLRTLKDLTFRTFAFGSGVMFEPGVLERLGVTKDQQDKLRALELKLQKEKDRRLRTATAEKMKTILGVLTPQQLAELRKKQPIEQYQDCSNYPYPGLPSHMPDTGATEELGLSEEQQGLVRKVIAAHWQSLGALQSEEQTLAIDDEKGRQAISEKRQQEMTNLRKQIEAALTPKQWAQCNEIAFENLAVPYLRIVVSHASGGGGLARRMAAAASVALGLGLTSEQVTALREIDAEYFDKPEQIYREMTDKALTAFTPAQQEKLRAEVDRRGW